jgi:hypothetical protein
MTETDFDAQAAHRKFAAQCFNACWEELDKQTRTPAEDERMIRLAEASTWHWSEIDGSTEQNRSISYWQLARAYALADRGEQALRYADQCVAVSEAGELDAFYRGYGYEARARALAVLGRADEVAGALEAGRAQAEHVEDEQNREVLVADLDDVTAALG